MTDKNARPQLPFLTRFATPLATSTRETSKEGAQQAATDNHSRATQPRGMTRVTKVNNETTDDE